MPAFIFTLCAYLLFILSFFFNPFVADCLRWLGAGGHGCALSTFAETLIIWMIIGLIGALIALVAVLRGRANLWYILALVCGGPPLMFLMMLLREFIGQL